MLPENIPHTISVLIIGAGWLMFLHQFHAALGAVARRVFHHFRVHRAGVLMSLRVTL
jgi:hypothetical protein